MKQHLLLALCLLISSFVWAQSPPAGTIKGTVLDSANQKPLGYVTVVLSHPDKNEPFKSTFTKDNGSFEFAAVPAGKYKLIVSFVGYKQQILPVNDLEAGKAVADVGRITLVSSAQQLKEVQVVTEKLLVTQDVDKLSYNVEVDPESKTLSALDMLRKVPMLSLDADDNIKVNGSGSFKVLVNGKASTLFARNPKDVFRSMPANTIKRIEVITDPPAKYDAEGIGGIINVITTDKQNNGYNGSVYAGQSTPNSRYGSVNLKAKTGKFGFSGYAGSNRFTSPSYTSTFERHDNRTGVTLSQVGNGDSWNSYNYADGEMSYEIDTLNLLSAKFRLSKGLYESDGDQLLNELNSDGILTKAYERNTLSKGNWGNYEVGLDYQHTFKRNKEQLLTLSYNVGNNFDNSNSNLDFVPVKNYHDVASTSTQNDGTSREQTMQLDYVHPIKKHTLELGAKTILRDNSSDYFYRNYNDETNSFIEVPELTNQFDYNQNIYAAYASASLRLKKWGVRMGTRLENTVVNAEFASSGTTADQDYVNFIPSIALTRTLKNMGNLRISYTQRIERPSLWYLNPYVNRTNEKSVSFGNPNLEAATSHVFSLGHNFFKGNHSLNSTFTHAFTDNAIQSYTTFNPADSVSSTSYGNIGKNSTSSLTLSGNSTLFKSLSLNLGGTLIYTQLSGSINGQKLENSGMSGYMYSGASYKLPKDWRVSANMGYYAPRVLLQGQSAGQFRHGFSASKDFLKDKKASISLSVQNPFQKHFVSYSELEAPDFIQRSEHKNITRRVSVGFNYKFGKLKEDIKRTKRGIKNDDLKGGESKGGSN